MKIIELKVTNFLKIETAEITPRGNVVVLAGKNGAGKSSLGIRAIWAALGGKDAALERPIRKGAEKAEILLTLGSDVDAPKLCVRRSFSAASTRLEVTEVRADGGRAKFSSPQRMVKALIDSMAIDPLRFCDLPSAAQVEEISRVVGLDVSDIDEEISRVVDERRDLNRSLRAAGEIVAPAGDPPTRIDLGELSKALDDARARVQAKALCAEKTRAAEHDLTRHRERRQALAQKKADLMERLAQVEQDISQISDAETAAEIRRDVLSEELRVHGTPTEDERALTEQLRQADEINRTADAYAAAVCRHEEHSRILAQAEHFTAKLASLRSARTERIAAVKMPLDGLSIGDGNIMIDGIPISQASTAQRLEIGARVAIAKRPRLRVFYVEHGSLLDEEMFARMRTLAEDTGCQWWVERVADHDEGIGFYIEDGRISDSDEGGKKT